MAAVKILPCNFGHLAVERGVFEGSLQLCLLEMVSVYMNFVEQKRPARLLLDVRGSNRGVGCTMGASMTLALSKYISHRGASAGSTA